MPRSLFPNYEAWRAVAIGTIIAIVFLATGSCAPPWVANLVGMAPLELDVSLRALSSGWFEADQTVPVTIVDIDEATHAAWGRPPITPRDDLARLVATVLAANPKAVVVDIDLSWGSGASDSTLAPLRRVLDRRQGSAPVLFPKRLITDSTGASLPAISGLDDLIGTRPDLGWAHAELATGDGGAVRHWTEWIDLCVAGVSRRLPAIAATVAATLGLRDPLPVAAGDCATTGPAPERRLLIGPRMTGPTRVPRVGAQAISAAFLLDTTIARDDGALFGDRVVLIGATHADAGDQWLTPAGIVPGVELLASTIHYLPLGRRDGLGSTTVDRIAAVALFVGLALLTWWLAGIVAVIGVIGAVLTVTAVAVGALDWFWFFDSLGAALVMIVGYEAARAVMELGVSFWRETREAEGPLRSRLWVALKTVSLRDQDATGASE